MIDLSTTYMGLNLKNPIIIASSGLTNSTKDIIELEEKGAAAVVTKSLFEEEIIAETRDNFNKMTANGFIFPETTEYFDFEAIEDTVSNYLKFLSDTKKSIKIPLIASINCINAEGWTDFTKRIEDTGVDAIELNIFSLPFDLAATPADYDKKYLDIVNKVSGITKLPIALKISFYHSNLGAFIQKLSKSGANAIVLFNRYYNPDFDVHNLQFTPSNVLSSPSDSSMPLRWIAIMSGRTSCDLAASTGVHDGTALIKQILVGAQAVQICSTLYKNGKDQIGLMINQLEQWMKDNGHKSLNEFRGKMSYSKTYNPAVFERVQFMKYFREFQQ